MIVIDMDMPKNCFECDYSLTDAHGAYCALADNEIKEGLDIYENTNNCSNICPIKCDILDIKAEIKSHLITHGQVVDGEYFAEDAEYINHGLNMALDIIDKHIK